jgi:hypothetical protein
MARLQGGATNILRKDMALGSVFLLRLAQMH